MSSPFGCRDVGRYTRLVDRGWAIYRYTKLEVYGDPDRIVAELTRARGRRARRADGGAAAVALGVTGDALTPTGYLCAAGSGSAVRATKRNRSPR